MNSSWGVYEIRGRALTADQAEYGASRELLAAEGCAQKLGRSAQRDPARDQLTATR